MSTDERDALYAGWVRAVERARGWATPVFDAAARTEYPSADSRPRHG